jgi:hypothetical protein
VADARVGDPNQYLSGLGEPHLDVVANRGLTREHDAVHTQLPVEERCAASQRNLLVRRSGSVSSIDMTYSPIR